MALIKQISSIVNDAVKDALGKNASATQLNTSDIVSLGKAITEFDAYEDFFKSLANRIVRTVYFVRRYNTNDRHILRDEHEYGAFVQKVYYQMPEAVDNPTYNYNEQGAFTQVSPYDVQTTIGVSALIYGGQGTWTIEIVRPVEQIKSAFLSDAAMLSFIDGMYVYVDNAFQKELESTVSMAANTGIANAHANGLSRNLLAEYNEAHPANTLTVAQALKSLDFLKFATMEITRTIDNMKALSTTFNAMQYETFTPRDKMVVEMLSHFTRACDMYLQADTFHNDLVSLPNFESVPFWQTSGKNFAFDKTSSINIKNTAITGTANGVTGGEVSINGVIAFIHDIEYVAAYFGERHAWELFNPRSDVIVHGDKARKGFAVDSHANGVVFYIADNNVDMTASVENWSAAQLLGGKSAANLQENIVIDNTNRTVTGTLKYVTGYTQFSGDEEEQSGNYLAIKLQPTPEVDTYVRLWDTKEWKKMDSDHILIGRITNKNVQKIYLKSVNDGIENYFTYSLTGLTLATA